MAQQVVDDLPELEDVQAVAAWRPGEHAVVLGRVLRRLDQSHPAAAGAAVDIPVQLSPPVGQAVVRASDGLRLDGGQVHAAGGPIQRLGAVGRERVVQDLPGPAGVGARLGPALLELYLGGVRDGPGGAADTDEHVAAREGVRQRHLEVHLVGAGRSGGGEVSVDAAVRGVGGRRGHGPCGHDRRVTGHDTLHVRDRASGPVGRVVRAGREGQGLASRDEHGPDSARDHQLPQWSARRPGGFAGVDRSAHVHVALHSRRAARVPSTPSARRSPFHKVVESTSLLFGMSVRRSCRWDRPPGAWRRARRPSLPPRGAAFRGCCSYRWRWTPGTLS